jgi:hypothetical protein
MSKFTGKEQTLKKKGDDKPKKQPPRDDDEDYEDGDMATPKRDRYGTDDEPL